MLRLILIASILISSLTSFSYGYMHMVKTGVLKDSEKSAGSQFEFSHSSVDNTITKLACTHNTETLNSNDQLAFTLTTGNKPDKKEKNPVTFKMTVSLIFYSHEDSTKANDTLHYDLGEIAPGEEITQTIFLGCKNFEGGIYEFSYQLNAITKGSVYHYVYKENSEEQILSSSAELDSDPEFDGSQLGMTKFIQTNLIYPEFARECGIQGTVYISFTVEPSGKLTKFEIVKGVDSILDNEVLRVVLKMPDWKPGILEGKPVRSQYVVPINFKIA